MADIDPKLLELAHRMTARRKEEAVETIDRERRNLQADASRRGLTGNYLRGLEEATAQAFSVLTDGLIGDLLELLRSLGEHRLVEGLPWARAFFAESVAGLATGFSARLAQDTKVRGVSTRSELVERARLKAIQRLEIELGKLELGARARAAVTQPGLDLSQAPREFDVFICHAGEDKEAVALPLAEALRVAGRLVWIDSIEVLLGDSTVDTVSRGMSRSRYGVVVLSLAFFAKPWPRRELTAWIAVGLAEDRSVLLPILHGISHSELVSRFPLIADLRSYNIADGIDGAVKAIGAVLDRG